MSSIAPSGIGRPTSLSVESSDVIAETVRRERAALEQTFKTLLSDNFRKIKQFYDAEIKRVQATRDKLVAETISRKVVQLFDDVIYLNVGGVVFHTSKKTLCREKGSVIGEMFSGRYKLTTDSSDCFVIDRDGFVFRYILNYLRDGSLFLLPSDDFLLRCLQTEATYFHLQGLCALFEKKQKQILLTNKPLQEINKNYTWKMCGPGAMVYNDHTLKTSHNGCTAAVLNLVMKKGVYHISFLIELGPNVQICVGLVTPQFKTSTARNSSSDLGQYIGLDAHTWSIASNGMKCYHPNGQLKYGDTSWRASGVPNPFVMDMVVDMNAHHVSFILNNHNLGMCFVNLPNTLMPAVSLVKGDVITFRQVVHVQNKTKTETKSKLLNSKELQPVYGPFGSKARAFGKASAVFGVFKPTQTTGLNKPFDF